jgi:hypothetical protein
MGFALCRFKDETGCQVTGSQEFHIRLEDLKVDLNVPTMWRHYMIEHLVQPNKDEMDTIMNADVNNTTGKFMQTRSMEQNRKLHVLYVEKTDSGYTHEIGEKVDKEFINKLDLILKPYQPIQAKGFPGMRS